MKSIPEIQGIISQPRFSSPANISSIPKVLALSSFLSKARENDRLEFVRVGFREPLLVVYSSGTTGQPRCFVHSVGGVLLNAGWEGGLHTEHGPDTVALQYTTTGWVMYLVAMQSLLFGTRVILYDGSPYVPDITALLTLAAQEKVTHLGISPRWMHELQRAEISPRDMFDLSSLRVVSSTGMVLRDAFFERFYDEGFPTHVRLNNIAGGTDIAGCFGISNPLVPVYVGGCAGCSLGISIDFTIPPSKEGQASRVSPWMTACRENWWPPQPFPTCLRCFRAMVAVRSTTTRTLADSIVRTPICLCGAVSNLDRHLDPRRLCLQSSYHQAAHVPRAC
jgi:acetoacetyl-CoA synthetase